MAGDRDCLMTTVDDKHPTGRGGVMQELTSPSTRAPLLTGPDRTNPNRSRRSDGQSEQEQKEQRRRGPNREAASSTER